MEVVIEHLIWTTIITLALAIGCVLFVIWLVHKLLPVQSSHRTPVTTGLVSIVVATILGIALNNIYGLRRDRDGRVWNLRQQHLSQLRPVLKEESDKLVALAGEFQTRGFLEGEHGGVRSAPSDLVPFLAPNVMSFDLANHYPQYAASKQKIEADIVNHDRKFSETVAKAQRELKVLGIHDISWFTTERLAETFVWACMGRGPGFTLNVSGGGWSMSIYGQGIGGGAPSDLSDVVDAYKRYRRLQPSQELNEACSSLRSSADSIESQARELSKLALLQAQETSLRGDCPFVELN